MKAVVIAGTHSSAGKTTVSIAVMRLLREAGKKVAPFKAGPDYIDPKFHKFVTGNSSFNLDSVMLDEGAVRYLFSKNYAGNDIAVVEGVMGLFDGSGTGSDGSTAHVAKIIGAPVILVVDAKGMAASAAAMINGYRNYDRDVNIKGVILNRISGKDHYNLLKTIIERDTGLKCAGYLANDDQIVLHSRHLGLVPVEELGDLSKKVEILAESAGSTIDITAIEEMAEMVSLPAGSADVYPGRIGEDLRIAVAMDEAFNFYYQDNINLMKETGIDLAEFSPVHDNHLPKDIDGLYLGGGFPEIFGDKLSANKTMLEEVRNSLMSGLPAYAECGGLMYLTSGITDKESHFFDTVNFFNCRTQMKDKLQRFGYCEIEYDGIKVKGHEFHHTTLEDIDDKDITFAYTVRKPGKDEAWKCGLSKKNVLAGYAHVHFYSNMEFFRKIVALFRRG